VQCSAVQCRAVKFLARSTVPSMELSHRGPAPPGGSRYRGAGEEGGGTETHRHKMRQCEYLMWSRGLPRRPAQSSPPAMREPIGCRFLPPGRSVRSRRVSVTTDCRIDRNVLSHLLHSKPAGQAAVRVSSERVYPAALSLTPAGADGQVSGLSGEPAPNIGCFLLERLDEGSKGVSDCRGHLQL
jgi:hypothetical protein